MGAGPIMGRSLCFKTRGNKHSARFPSMLGGNDRLRLCLETCILLLFCFETFIVFYLISIYIQPLLNNRVSGMSNSMRMLREKVDCICSKADKVPLNRSFQREKRT